jgi:hypothetical protein
VTQAQGDDPVWFGIVAIVIRLAILMVASEIAFYLPRTMK